LFARGIVNQFCVKSDIGNAQTIKIYANANSKKLLRKPLLNEYNKHVRLNFSRNKMNLAKKGKK